MPANSDLSALLMRLPWMRSTARRSAGRHTSQRVHTHADPQTRAGIPPTGRPTLAELPPGESATIGSILGTSHTRLHLLEMGLTPGTRVQVLRAAAFGGPLDLMVRGYRLSLRRSEAHAIELKETLKR